MINIKGRAQRFTGGYYPPLLPCNIYNLAFCRGDPLRPSVRIMWNKREGAETLPYEKPRFRRYILLQPIIRIERVGEDIILPH